MATLISLARSLAFDGSVPAPAARSLARQSGRPPNREHEAAPVAFSRAGGENRTTVLMSLQRSRLSGNGGDRRSRAAIEASAQPGVSETMDRCSRFALHRLCENNMVRRHDLPAPCSVVLQLAECNALWLCARGNVNYARWGPYSKCFSLFGR